MTTQRKLWSIPDACDALGVSRSRLYKCMDEGELESIKVGNRRLIPTDALDKFIEAKRQQQGATDDAA